MASDPALRAVIARVDRGQTSPQLVFATARFLGAPVAPQSPDPSKTYFFLAKDGQPVAFAGGYGQSLHWFD